MMLNILHCNGKDPLTDSNRNHFLPLIDSEDLAEGLGFSIVWGNIQAQGAGDALSDAGTDSWENISVASDVQSVHSLADFDVKRQELVENKDVKIAVVVYRKQASEVGVVKERKQKAYNFIEGDFDGLLDDPKAYAEILFEQMAWVEDPRCFAILPRIMVVQEKEQLILIFPALCNCELRLINDMDHEFEWMNASKFSNDLPTTMKAVVSRGASLLDAFKDELPPLEDRNTREAAEIIMSVLRRHANRLGKGGIQQYEMIEYLCKHPDDMTFMLEISPTLL
eukprot:TRINITY_DN292_c0_g1_i2.p1 TRINITY_DN292_c0_g1~~TRINITY_DN292_c0_g1_i2.p1  ORF type:complete len:290 (+),score=60.68 TRINITY_DN292_c0_g1_i2:30-872(+)